ncbi:peptidoglycan-binding protein [Kitasatospora sp. NPDC058201]|uniref:peptidoglycan-binding domain-containing protein n=1 Tax=unclassified Kitasatospora TaxID=2633591 RepID=UPI00364755C8
MSSPPRALSDAEPGGIPPSSARRAVARDRALRYGDVVLAYASDLCATPRAAHTLATDVLDRAVDDAHREQDRSSSWICLLLGEARLLAADWADTGRSDDLSPDFRAWLSVRRTPHRSHREAVAAAEEESPLQGALAQLTDLPAAELWWALAPATGPERTPAASPDPSEQARRILADAYIRVHAVGAPERRCRHLAALIAEVAGTDTAPSMGTAAHLAQCNRCRGALADLRAIHRWESDHLRNGLLAAFRPAADARPEPVPVAVSATSPDPAPDLPPDLPPDLQKPAPSPEPSEIDIGRAHRRAGRPSRHTALRRRIAVGAAGVGTVALALGLAMADTRAGHVTGPPTADRTPAAADDLAPGPTVTKVEPLPPAPESPPATRTPSPRRTRTGSASPTANTGASAGPSAGPSPSATTAPALPSGLDTPGPPSTPSAQPSSAAPSVAPSTTPSAPPAAPPSPSPSATESSPVRSLRRGDSGPEVVRLQKLLVKAGCAPGDSAFERGRFDPATERVLATFQQSAGIRGDERAHTMYGARTRAALEQSAAGPRCRSGQAPQNG